MPAPFRGGDRETGRVGHRVHQVEVTLASPLMMMTKGDSQQFPDSLRCWAPVGHPSLTVQP